MTTLEVLKELVSINKEERKTLVKVKKDGSKYVPEQNRKDYVMNNYVIFLGEKCIKIVEKGHTKQELIDGLKITNWRQYSFKSRAYYKLDSLCYYLAVKPTTKTKMSDLFNMQADALQRAANAIIELLENTVTIKGGAGC